MFRSGLPTTISLSSGSFVEFNYLLFGVTLTVNSSGFSFYEGDLSP